MLLVILAVLLVLAIAGGGWGHSRFGYVGWSPAAVLLLVCLALLVTGQLRIG